MLRYGFSLWISTAAGGASRDRTDDPLLAKQVLSQLSYVPAELVGLGRVELPTSPLSGVRSNQLSYRPAAGTPETQNNLCERSRALSPALLEKGGDPAAGSPTATLLRLHPSHCPYRGRRPPCG